jgi:3-deoxy-7-phosphoheptulonate synthase
MRLSLCLAAALPVVTGMVATNPIKPTFTSSPLPNTEQQQQPPHVESDEWSPSSWRTKEAKQIPKYPDEEALKQAEYQLSRSAPLVFAGEVRNLGDQLAAASMGNAFVIFGGDCAESFDEFSTDHIRDTFRVILQMALIMTHASGKPVVKIGRMAGQFAKPRSEPLETIDGVTLPSYQGDNINSESPFTAEARQADPQKMIKAYDQCTQTLNILRAFSDGGYANLSRLNQWTLDFVEGTPQGSRYRQLARKVEESLRFMKACGVDLDSKAFSSVDFFTAHECLLLPYEEAMTRRDSTTGDWYDTSAHLLWVGERTRQPGFAHFEFVRGLKNPLGVKVSDKATPEDVLTILDTFNPDNIPGRVTLITRMTAAGIRKSLPGMIKAVQKAGKHVVWCSDPVHGNGFKAENGFKTRSFDAIRDELIAFFDVHRECGSHPGGIHLEMTGKDVTECLGGDNNGVTLEGERGLATKYMTHCDPRLNAVQSLELAFCVADKMREANGISPDF